MGQPNFDFSRLSGFELFGLDYTLSRLVVAEFLGPAKDESGNDIKDALTQIYLYFVECTILDAEFKSNPKTSSSFPPLDRIDCVLSDVGAYHKYTSKIILKPGFIRLDFNDVFHVENKLPMSHI